MRNVAPARKTIGIRTVFNLVGPLSNPCTNISGQVIGVFEPSLMDTFAEVCQSRGGEVMIVHASDGFDELSNTCGNDVLWLTEDRQTKRIRLTPRVLGIAAAKPEQLIVNTKQESIKSTLDTIYGYGPQEKQDIVLLNASAALVVGKLARDFKEGIEIARNSVTSGQAREKLEQLVSECGNKEIFEQVERKNRYL
jgi:anthranilate phosphoribosyltransferase